MNDNDIMAEFDYDEITDEEISLMLGSAAKLGTLAERKITLIWLRKNAADFLFAPGMDPKLQEYGTTVLELVADAIEDLEHWHDVDIGKETLQ